MKNSSLQKQYTIKRREHLIETDYIDGIYDKNGIECMRPLTDDEKQWLNQYYTETVHADYSKHPEVKKLNKQKNNIVFDDNIKKKMDEYQGAEDKTELNRMKRVVRDLKKVNISENQEEYNRLMMELEQVKSAVMLTYDIKSEIYKENKKRNEDLYTKSVITGKLKSTDNLNPSEILETSIYEEDPEILVSFFRDMLKK